MEQYGRRPVNSGVAERLAGRYAERGIMVAVVLILDTFLWLSWFLVLDSVLWCAVVLILDT
jgi:hypothetical protein